VLIRRSHIVYNDLMISEGSLVIYKNKPAVVKEQTDGKFLISLAGAEQIKVRDKDIELIHPGPVKNFDSLESIGTQTSAIREAWELLLDEGSSMSLNDFSSFIFNEYTPASAYAVFILLRDGLYFSGSISAISPRNKDEVIAEELKREAARRETGERAQFLERLKSCLKKSTPMLPDDARFFQDVEALSYGKSLKSRTMKEIETSETPEDAHSVLLKTGIWTNSINPHPARFGLSLSGASVCPKSDEKESCIPLRADLCRLASFAIDSPWSSDPDDAVSIETLDNGCCVLYVHVADPASLIAFDSPAEKEARDRGATLYLPEATVRMLADESLPLFALGLSEKSAALTFKLLIDAGGNVTETEIFPSIVQVRRITYEQADKELDRAADEAADGAPYSALQALYSLSQKIFNRRASHGAVNIDFPDIHITAKDGNVSINPIAEYRSACLVKECMIAAGEGAGTWAASRGLAFPYISQEVELQPDHARFAVSGFAGSYQIRRCMRPRILSVKPGRHQGLGLDTYTQVTSPLRRYTDLLAHIQIRAFLRGEKPLGADDISARLGFSEAASVAVVHAERASVNHWKMVYLSCKKDSVWNAVALENKGNRWAVLIPSLALETQVSLKGDVSPNDEINLILKSVNIPRGEAVFSQEN